MPHVNIGDLVKAPEYGLDKMFVVTQLDPGLAGARIIDDDRGRRLAMDGSINGDIEVIGSMALEEIVEHANDVYQTHEMRGRLLASLLEQAAKGPIEHPGP